MSHSELLQSLAEHARSAGVFAEVEVHADRLRCMAKDAPAPAWYELATDGDAWTIRFATPDRWLSESVEADLMHTGDPLEELLEEELAEHGWIGSVPQVRHFRDDARVYIFENTLPTDGDARDLAGRFLLAYEAAFRELGDVAGGDEDE